jgi:hypothetical protein
VDLVVRASHDRQLSDDVSLFDAPQSWPILGHHTIEVPPQRNGNMTIAPARTATVAIRAGAVEIPRPVRGYDANTLKTVSLTLVELQEVNPPAGAEPVAWRLLTTLKVESASDAQKIVRIYKLRWKIEIPHTAYL